MSKELEEVKHWVRGRIAYIVQNCDLEDLENKRVYDILQTILHVLDNSINKEVIEKEKQELEEMKVEGDVFKTSVNFAIKVLQELLEEK